MSHQIPSDFFFPIGTDFYVRVYIRSVVDKNAVTGVTVAGQLYDFDGSTVGGSITGTEISNGYYSVVVPDTASLVAGEEFTLRITATKTTNKATFDLTGKALYSVFEEKLTIEILLNQ